VDNILIMIVKKDIKLELKFKFYLRSSVSIKLTKLSSAFTYTGANIKLYTSPDGFIIDTGYLFSYNRSGMTIPAYIFYDECDNSDLCAYFNFESDTDRYNSLKRLYNYLEGLSQSRIFQYDNTGYVDSQDDKWILY